MIVEEESVLYFSNVLVLDEPTNHMDLEAIEALRDALIAYKGTVFVVSHNRHFLSQVATRILYISKEKGIQDFEGTYEEFEAVTNT